MPQGPGVYLFLDEKGNVLYVGKAKSLKHRVSSYFLNKKNLGAKTSALIAKVKKIKVVSAASEIESLLLEANFIKKYSPSYNVRLIDGKSYPFIRVTINDAYPKVLVARRMGDTTSLYFGPYPNTGAMHLVLRTIRRIFPFQSVMVHEKKPCLYYHLNLCPCPTVFKDTEYRKDIARIVKLLSGKTRFVLRDLERKKEAEVRNEQFEKAAVLQRKINAMHLITDPIHKPFEYETNPNLLSDLRRKEADSLKEQLRLVDVDIESLSRIECYDISNTSGTHAVGSMVVFVDGEKDVSEYRRFKIRGVSGQNDVAMISEILKRRLKHADWELPELIIVDGGKGQISSALKALHDANISIPIIGLAKREEIIITSDFKEIRLPRDSETLHLVMRIRDEAHRFAITYHRKLRSVLPR